MKVMLDVLDDNDYLQMIVAYSISLILQFFSIVKLGLTLNDKMISK
jgi:hypothetical protein